MSTETFLKGRVVLHCGDSRDVLKTIPDCSIDSIVTDPPYALVSIVKRFQNGEPSHTKTAKDIAGRKTPIARLAAGFMGKKWDTGETAFAVEFWAECLRVLKPGGHVVAFSGTRTYHRMAVAIEDAGFEVRDMLSWLYGSGFPKSHDVSKQLDKTAGHWRGRAGAVKIEEQTSKGTEYERSDKGDPITAAAAAAAAAGWGTALKPACEPICFGRKPMSGTVAANWLEHGTGAINIDGCRVGTEGETFHAPQSEPGKRQGVVGIAMQATGGPDRNQAVQRASIERTSNLGRWPANVLHDGHADVLDAFPNEDGANEARYFYTAKADGDDRLGSKHPTVKPVDLMQWLCRLVTPKGGTILDPFSGTGTTGEAAFREGFNAVLIEREEEYQADIRRRMALCTSGPDERKRESVKAKFGDVPFEAGSLFADLNPQTESDTPPPATREANLRSVCGRTIGPIGMKR